MNYEQITDSASVVLVEFYATWCMHCQHMEPVVEQLKEILAGKVKIIQLDVDQNQELCDQQNIQGTPTFILYKNGQEVWRQSGEMPGKQLLSTIEKYM